MLLRDRYRLLIFYVVVNDVIIDVEISLFEYHNEKHL